jgi:hypothetical protein
LLAAPLATALLAAALLSGLAALSALMTALLAALPAGFLLLLTGLVLTALLRVLVFITHDFLL